MKRICSLVLLLVAMFSLRSCSDKCISFRKIPCEEIKTYKNQGNLNGTYLTVFYAIDYHQADSAIVSLAIQEKADSIFSATSSHSYSRVTCHFLKESNELKRIKSCEVTDAHNIFSSEHESIFMTYKDK
jgi:hypothetical protein